MIRLLCIAGIFLLICDFCPAESVSQVTPMFYSANTFYAAGEYDKAIKGYEEALKSGFKSGNLYYNLGNSYFKKGLLGRALLNYEKAMRLMPGDNDLKSNYEYARSLIKGGVIETKAQWYKIIFGRIFSPFTIDGLAFALAVIFTVILLVILIAAYIPSVRKYKLGALLTLAVIFVLFFAAIFEKASIAGKEAVIIVEKTDAKFEPFDSATTHFTLYEGTKAAVISSKDSWYKIERPDNKSGWVKTSDLEVF